MEENENLRISACDTVMILFRSSLRFGRCRTDVPWTSQTVDKALLLQGFAIVGTAFLI